MLYIMLTSAPQLRGKRGLKSGQIAELCRLNLRYFVLYCGRDAKVGGEILRNSVEVTGMTRCVIVVGAGATRADFAGTSQDAPPLDRNFFSDIAESNLGEGKEFKEVSKYLHEAYSIDLCDPGDDSLENILSIIYSDLYNGDDRDWAADAFRHMLQLLYKRIRQTTKSLNLGRKGGLYRLLRRLFERGMNPKDITILTFNYDLQIEKAVCLFDGTKKWSHLEPVFCFPWCYALSGNPGITNPSGSASRFKRTNATGGVQILKLHGSLNWYSRHMSPTPGPGQLFRTNRKLRITTRRDLASNMLASGGRRRWNTFPVIMPPVGNKATFIHEQFRGLWSLARHALTNTERVIFYGYSCPSADVESSNMIRQSLGRNQKLCGVDIVDPSSDTFGRYAHLIDFPKLAFYRNVDAYLQYSEKS